VEREEEGNCEDVHLTSDGNIVFDIQRRPLGTSRLATLGSMIETSCDLPGSLSQRGRAGFLRYCSQVPCRGSCGATTTYSGFLHLQEKSVVMALPRHLTPSMCPGIPANSASMNQCDLEQYTRDEPEVARVFPEAVVSSTSAQS